MSALVFDIIRRYLEYQEFEVRHVMNYTDVDDKIIKRANQENRDPFELAEHYIQKFNEHLEVLNILPATVNPRATQDMNQIIFMIQGLVDKSYAYESGGDVYFRVEKFDGYGKLSGRKLEDMQAGARIEVDQRKENPLDFTLWKAAKPGEPAWKSPFGDGRPGWHIECSAMCYSHLGDQIDIHGGGNDLIFPHHENEIAQSESFTGNQFARYWVHNGMVQLSGEKMSKSLGNLVSMDEFLSEFEGDVLRMMVLNSHYRSPLTFNEETISHAQRALERLRSGIRPALTSEDSSTPSQKELLKEQIGHTRSGFIESMDDDFNTAGALGSLFDLVRAINSSRDAGMDSENLLKAQNLLSELASVLGLKLESAPSVQTSADPFIDMLVAVREELRGQKLWDLSDEIRDHLDELGVSLEDGKEGTTWRWK
jgi:cysteinyl-tRNA synthetase